MIDPTRHVRREFLALLAGSAALPLDAHAQPASTAVWPLPYAKVSAQSVEWLEAKKWWPLNLAWQPAFAGHNATTVSMMSNDLLGKRGLEAKLEAMPNGGSVNKAIIAGTAQLGSAGNFPLTTLVDQGAPIRVVAITAPNLKHYVIVPNDSPIKKLSDFKGAKTPATIGMVLGTSSEFYFQAAAAANGVRVGTDVVSKNVTQPEQAKMPKDLAAVVPWDPTATLIVNELKVGRAIDVSYPYNVYQGSFYIRKELLDEVPDVAQAITEPWSRPSC